MNIHHSPNIPIGIKEEGSYIFKKSKILCKNLCTVPLDSCTIVTSQILEECHLRGRHTQN